MRIGDIVRLNSGGPLMTVCEQGSLQDEEGQIVAGIRCKWIQDDGWFAEEIFPAEALIQTAPEPELSDARSLRPVPNLTFRGRRVFLQGLKKDSPEAQREDCDAMLRIFAPGMTKYEQLTGAIVEATDRL